MPPWPDEQDLITKIVAGDQEAMNDLIARSRPQIVARLNAEGISGQDRGDLAQEVLSAAFSQIQRGLFRGESSLITWIAAIARGKAMDYKRSRSQRQLSVTDSVDALPASAPAPVELTSLADHELTLIVRQTLQSLSREERTVLKLKEMDGYTVREIAALSGLPEKRIYRLLEKARERFRRELSSQNIHDVRMLE